MPIATDDSLAEQAAARRNAPLSFVLWAFPWGQPGTPLENETGPDRWQWDVLRDLGRQMHARDMATIKEPICLAIAAGHGAGLTTLLAWVQLWFMSTRMDPQAVATAGTHGQLFNKMWPTLRGWHGMAKTRDWFRWTPTTFDREMGEHHKPRAVAIPWSTEQPEAFLGGGFGKHYLAVFDGAAVIPNDIWDAVEASVVGCPGGIWLVGGVPAKTHVDQFSEVKTRFRECWTARAHRWTTFNVDSRNAKMVNQQQTAAWIAEYGEDSEFSRMRIRGLFPAG